MDAQPMLTTAEAARQLGITRGGVHKLMTRGVLPRRRNGRDYYFYPPDIEAARVRRGPGRPKLDQAANA